MDLDEYFEIYKNYKENDEQGYYNVYTKFFQDLEKEEKLFDKNKKLPSFGNSKSKIEDVLSFYNIMNDFTTSKNYSWLDKVNTTGTFFPI
jgi:hypothetical protein